MWRKIHSNRDPRDTLYSELRKEFSPWFRKAKRHAVLILSVYPKLFFAAMIILLLVSVALSFTVFRHPEKTAVHAETKSPSPLSAGFNQIMSTAGRLGETLALKYTVDSLTGLKQLSAKDSLLLDSALDRLRSIHQLSK